MRGGWGSTLRALASPRKQHFSDRPPSSAVPVRACADAGSVLDDPELDQALDGVNSIEEEEPALKSIT